MGGGMDKKQIARSTTLFKVFDHWKRFPALPSTGFFGILEFSNWENLCKDGKRCKHLSTFGKVRL